MKCYIALTAPISDTDVYVNLLAVTLRSARKNTTLDLYALYDGPTTSRCYQLLQENNVTIISHQFSHKQYLEKTYPKEYLLQYHGKLISYDKLAGTFMRLDIPFIEQEDKFVLYVDIDVMFLQDIKLEDLPKPTYLAASSEFFKDLESMTYFNAGILLMNVKNMRSKCQNIFNHLKAGEPNKTNIFDQGYLNDECFEDRTLVPLEYNWKPYWGINPQAKIIHFHGLKPSGDFESSGFGMNEEVLGETVFGHTEDIAGYMYYFSKFFAFLGTDGTEWISHFTTSLCRGCLIVQKLIYKKRLRALHKVYAIVLGILVLLAAGAFLIL